jgi:hypothetical protein
MKRPKYTHVAQAVTRPARTGGSVRDKMPEFADDWHPTRNGAATPEQVAYSSNLRADWKCRACEHEWQVTVGARWQIYRRKGPAYGCRRCSVARRDTPEPGKSLADLHPALITSWGTGNATGVTPWTVKPGGSAKTYWWRCLASVDHPEWRASPSTRRRSGCPVCSGRAISPQRNLAAQEPDVAAEWHPSRNGDLRPWRVSRGSTKRVWWLCPRGHEWLTTVNLRTSQRTRCPTCSTSHRSDQEVELFGQLAAVLRSLLGPGGVRHHARLATLPPRAGKVDILITPLRADLIVVEFDGGYWHGPRQEQDIAKAAAIRAAGHHLIRVREQPLTLLHPDDVSAAPGEDPRHVAAAVLERITGRGWLGDHISAAAAACTEQTARAGAALARHLLDDRERRDLGEECLAETDPELAAEWDQEANLHVTPRHVRADSSEPAWWICPLGDAYDAPPGQRKRGRGCPFCAGKRANARNSIAGKHPDLVDEWDTELNALEPAQVVAGSHDRVHWKCRDCGHRWQTAVKNRTRNRSGCPACSRRGRRRTAPPDHDQASSRGSCGRSSPPATRSWSADPRPSTSSRA